MGKVRRPSGVMVRTVWPSAARSLAVISKVRTTPLTWGAQASVTIRIFKCAATPGTGPGTSLCALRGYRHDLGRGGLSDGLSRSRSGALWRMGCPAQNLHSASGIFDKGAAAFNPVSVIEVEHVADLADFGMVDMAADHAVHAAHLRLARHDLFEARDVFDCVLDLVLQPGRQRPVGQAQ